MTKNETRLGLIKNKNKHGCFKTKRHAQFLRDFESVMKHRPLKFSFFIYLFFS